MTVPYDLLLENCNVATMTGDAPYGAIEDAAIGISGSRITFVGPRKEAGTAKERIDLKRRWVAPGLIDCHTHIVYGGDRANEFELRLKGATYEEIAKAGGGIVSTVKATRAASEDELVASAAKRVKPLLNEGVTVLEIKSGYGLDLDTERRMLKAARAIGRKLPVTVRTTCLAAHALPPEYKDRADAYIDLVCNEITPALAKEGLVDAVDVFCEKIAFSPEQTRRVFDVAKQLGIPVKLHAEQLSDLNGAALAAEYGALSAEHLEWANDAGIAAMGRSGTVAVLLPGAFYALRETRLPPIESFRKHGVAMALATDSNPGSSPALSLLLMLSMACTFFRFTPEEALRGITVNAAKALGLQASHGTIEAGKAADLAVFDIGRPAELAYWIGGNPTAAVLRAGRWSKPLCN
ncbi:imidazolonepropionase [Dongia sedimenti]|uniref:Imidazolonepropionase n=1 Tax=Dongia sedimenti TaxID=3064282 RepID=A0ABU0YJP5_9PROT|nr:imidazolonepropionase [Rhodospirillaceae bacterium R-7]